MTVYEALDLLWGCGIQSGEDYERLIKALEDKSK